ncbi:MAG TPA: DUF488 family protein [Verrucomicrobiae bacterium]|jgi:uncharacterized protein YeaO (DUF488 family)|nr:DUF488 family protein [Verrucomicrobiae bacterium]
MPLKLKSAYETYEPADGERYLVETLWPEGMDAYTLAPYTWMHELAPSYELKEMRIWKHWTHDRFLEEYEKELREPDRRACFEKMAHKAKTGIVTLLHHSRKKEWEIGPEHTTAYDLREFLRKESAPQSVKD